MSDQLCLPTSAGKLLRRKNKYWTSPSYLAFYEHVKEDLIALRMLSVCL